MKTRVTDTHYRTCNLCEAMCGIAIETEKDQIVSIKGDVKDALSKGHICPKALALKDLHEDPDRLREPLLKTAQGWKKISWNKAFDIAASKLKGIQKQYGQDAVGLYLGNPNAHHHGNALYLPSLFSALNTRNRFAATSLDQLPHMRANFEMFGHQGLFPLPDIDHTDLFILMGSNPAASNGSLVSVPDYMGRLKAIKKRGGEVLVIDPRRTETTKVTDHLFIKPGTDAFFLLGLVHTLFEEGLVETGRLTNSIDNIAQVQLLCSDYSADFVSPLCGIDADQIRALARKLASTPRAVLFGRMGTSTQEFGGIATWLIYVINVLTNHMDERGGLMFSKPAADLVEIGALVGLKGSHNTYQSVTGLPEFADELPSSTMADQIECESDMQIKAMLFMAGNPVISSPNSKRLAKALDSLEFMISIDSYVNETSQLADLILPSSTQLERSHYDLIFNMLSLRNVAKYSPPLFKPAKNTKHDWEIIVELSRRLTQRGLTDRVKSEVKHRVLQNLGPDGMLDILLRVGPYGTQIPGTSNIGAFLIDTMQDVLPADHPIRHALAVGPYGAQNRGLSKGLCLASLKEYPHGIDLGPLQSSLPDRLFTPAKRIRLVPPAYIQDMSRVRKRAEQLMERSEDSLVLIGRRDLRSNNSWLHNSARLMKGKPRCTMLIHPNDADARNIKEGSLVTVSTHVGRIDIHAQISDEMMPGVVSIPHGWGHRGKNLQMSIAQQHPGVNVNELMDERAVDCLTGTSVLNGVPVTVNAVKVAKSDQGTGTKSATKLNTSARKVTSSPVRKRVSKASTKTSSKAPIKSASTATKRKERVRVSAKLD